MRLFPQLNGQTRNLRGIPRRFRRSVTELPALEQGNRGTGNREQTTTARENDEPWPPEPQDAVDAEVLNSAPKFIDNPSRPTPPKPTDAARTVVRTTLGTGYPRTTIDRLAVQVIKLAREGHPDALIREALHEWDHRADCMKAEFLPTVLGDIVKRSRAAQPPTATSCKEQTSAQPKTKNSNASCDSYDSNRSCHDHRRRRARRTHQSRRIRHIPHTTHLANAHRRVGRALQPVRTSRATRRPAGRSQRIPPRTPQPDAPASGPVGDRPRVTPRQHKRRTAARAACGRTCRLSTALDSRQRIDAYWTALRNHATPASQDEWENLLKQAANQEHANDSAA
ncbi:bacteriophage gp78 domain protein [Mycobacterium xenopi 3993]|nr:bacteriophage gp78 domain protein [Mycobacterium xenopi 3993]